MVVVVDEVPSSLMIKVRRPFQDSLTAALLTLMALLPDTEQLVIVKVER